MTVFGFVTTSSSHHYTQTALESFFAFTPLTSNDEVVLIDNNGDFPEYERWNAACTIVKNPEPLGFAGNGNQLLRVAQSRNTDLLFSNNDVLFTEKWFGESFKRAEALMSPLSNQQVQYGASVFTPQNEEIKDLFLTGGSMALEQYKTNPHIFHHLAHVHHRTTPQHLWRLMVVPFFCIFIPAWVSQKVGGFDENFGVGGGEDYDYCLRAYLAGAEVSYALGSLVFHFGGKSTWSKENEASQILSGADSERVARFKAYFREKWGQDLLDLVLHEKHSILEEKYGSPTLRCGEDYKRLIQAAAPRLPEYYLPLSQ